MIKRGYTIWMTGLSGAGKSTLADAVRDRLLALGVPHVPILDGDIVRKHISRGLGFSRADRDENIRRIAIVARMLVNDGIPNIVAAISPYRDTRRQARDAIGEFVEVFVRCPLEICAGRDVKGLYAKAFTGEIAQFTGVSDPYEAPLNPEVVVDTARLSEDEAADAIVADLVLRGLLPVAAA